MAWKRLIILFSFCLYITISHAEEFVFKKIINLNDPWGSTFTSNENLLITEKSGKIKLINLDTKKILDISHNLNVLEHGQGGLLDIIYQNKTVWVSYTENRGDFKTSTSIAKGKFKTDKINFKNIFQAYPAINSRYHFGSRLGIKDQYLYASVGERG